MHNDNIEILEIDLLLEAIFRKWGYDFRNYARASLERRVRNTMVKLNANRISELIPLVIHSAECFYVFLKEISITVTEMFRDPNFFTVLRTYIIPELSAWSHIKIWCAGCATGEEVYSLAILLMEEDILHDCQIYATDFNSNSLTVAKEGVYPLSKMKLFVDNYNRSGGKKDFADYYQAKYEAVMFDQRLKDQIVFSHHNLISDESFGEMNLILCRNVLIYFNQTLQNRVLTLFDKSLCYGGFLCLGTKESLEFSGLRQKYSQSIQSEKIFRKNYKIGI